MGGVSDGLFGASVMDYDKGGVVAKKSYFFTPEGFVCLGAGISSVDSDRVLTTLNQSRLMSTVSIYADGSVSKLEGETAEDVTADAIHHDGIAYVMLESGRIGISAREQEGSWQEIEAKASDEPTPQDIFTAWIDHGPQPNDGSYAYWIVPGKESDALESLAKNEALRVLSNTSELQAVYDRDHAVTQAIFHAPGQVTLQDGVSLSVDRPCALVWRVTGDSVLLTASDPAQSQAHLIVTLSGRFIGRGASPTDKGTQVVIDLPEGQHAGQSVILPLTTAR